MMDQGLTQAECVQFQRDGFVIARRLAAPAKVRALRQLTMTHAERGRSPIEYEADVRYPGSPAGRDAPGGDTPRRLLQAYHRDPMLAEWATDPALLLRLRQLLDDDSIRLTRSHHNCVMTKCPRFSSDTGWHQDVRYWSFSTRQLVNSWLALGSEYATNGGLRVIPGSQAWRGLEQRDRLDTGRFLKLEHPENRNAIDAAVAVDLEPGDVLFFHAALFHSASRNHTDQVKYSVVFTYHGQNCLPLPATKSSQFSEIEM